MKVVGLPAPSACLAVCWTFGPDCFVLSTTVFAHLPFYVMSFLTGRFGLFLFCVHCIDTDRFVLSAYVFCVASLICNDSNAFLRLQSFSLNNLARAPLSRHPSTRRSLSISSCKLPKLHEPAKCQRRIIYWSTVSFGCCSAVWKRYHSYRMFLVGAK